MDAQFLTPLCIEEQASELKRLIAPLEFYSAELRGVVVVETGFETDYATVPRLAQGVIPKDGPWRWGCVLHDAGYRACLYTEHGQRLALIKPLADRLFLEGMAAMKVNVVTRRFMYWAVTHFGGRPYGGLAQPVMPPLYAKVITESLQDGTAWA